MLFKIGRKLSTSGAISSIYEIYNPPITIKILFASRKTRGFLGLSIKTAITNKAIPAKKPIMLPNEIFLKDILTPNYFKLTIVFWLM